MKIMKKVASVLLAMVMAFAMTMPVFAADTYYTITAPNNGHTYEIYQIFTGDLDKNVLSNVKWGVNGTGTAGEAVSDDILKKLEAVDVNASNTAKLAVISEYVKLSTPYKTLASGEDVEVPEGYYLIKDKDGSVPDNDTYTKYIVKIVNDVTIDPKSDKPTSEKKVKDTNDSTGETTNWQDSADYDIGDKVPFQLKATIGSDYDNYKTYYLVFHDEEEKGLTFDQDSVEVYVGETKITSGYKVVTTGLEDECTFEVVFNELKDIEIVKAGSVITVEYKSTLNENAVIGNAGNPNTMHIEYSNNPNDDQGGKPETTETPDDTVIVFTYKVTANKVTADEEALAGAAFELYKKNSDGEWESLGVVGATKNDDGEYVVVENNTTFSWTGLDDGDYKLVEVVTPKGYNTINAIEFTITASHDIESDDPKLTELKGGDLFTGEVSTGTLTSNIVNNKGATLPETGGIGTTVFYALGSILVVGAVVLLISKKRMDAK